MYDRGMWAGAAIVAGFSRFFSETLQERAAQSDWTDSKRIRFQN